MAKEIVDSAFRIHSALGPGLLESVTTQSWRLNGVAPGCARHANKPIPIVYENHRIDTGFRADLVVDDKVIVEVKSVGSQETTSHLLACEPSGVFDYGRMKQLDRDLPTQLVSVTL